MTDARLYVHVLVNRSGSCTQFVRIEVDYNVGAFCRWRGSISKASTTSMLNSALPTFPQ